MQTVKVKVSVIVRLQFEGIHCWPDCNIEQVSFLRQPHRHIFHVEAEKEVSHDNREVEIIMLKRAMEIYCRERKDYGSESCEMIARNLLHLFSLKSCTVLEDGENGARVTRC